MMFQQFGDTRYKRSPCKFWLAGTCQRGSACTWSHGDDDGNMAASPAMVAAAAPAAMAAAQQCPMVQNGASLMWAGQSTGTAPAVKKTYCKFFAAGHCELGDMCTWAHGPQDIGTPIIAQPAVPGQAHIPPAGGQVTRTLCKFWQEGICKNGMNCTFAHGEEDLGRPIPLEQTQATDLQGMVAAATGAAVPQVAQQFGGSSGSSFLPAMGSPLAGMKRTICKFWQQGLCERGDACTWAHGEEELGQPAAASPGAPLSAVAAQAQLFKPSLPAQFGLANGCAGLANGCGVGAGVALNGALGKGKAGFKGGFAATPRPRPQFNMAAAMGAVTPTEDPVGFKRNICKFWMEGTCQKGELCTWAHGEQELGQPVDGITAALSTVPTKRSICKFWTMGACERGELCTWAHGEQELGQPAPVLDANDAELAALQGSVSPMQIHGAIRAGADMESAAKRPRLI
mmetsp:Transcript_12331/g.28929  ORF Transcript_12331/g.28929 Transcript_12331/m.28929 type:complete len:456 (+) Transcript_12331:120-1487(+)